jgi:hypothetical protein
VAPLTRRRLCSGLASHAALALVPRAVLAASPVIAAGREAEVMALFAPFALGAALTPEMKLWNVRVEAEHISVEMTGSVTASFRLEHPERSSGTERSDSFVIVRDAAAASGAGKRAADMLVARVRANDAGDFWDQAADPFGDPAPNVAPPQRFRGLWLPIVVTVGAAATAVWLARRPRGECG